MATPFTNSVLSRLPRIIDQIDLPAVHAGIESMERAGWNIDDVVTYCGYMCYFNDTIDEDLALKLMSRISSKYDKTV